MSYYRAAANSNAAFITALVTHNVLHSPAVKEALLATDRAFYCDSNPYFDAPQATESGQTISAPHMHVMALEELEDQLTKPNARALDVGVGSGFLAAAMARMGAQKVVGIDVFPELVERAKRNLATDQNAQAADSDAQALFERIDVRVGDGWQGAEEDGPFDAIHVGAAAATVPKKLLAQLANGGKMIIPVGPDGETQVLLRIEKDDKGKATQTVLSYVRYVPLVGKDGDESSKEDL